MNREVSKKSVNSIQIIQISSRTHNSNVDVYSGTEVTSLSAISSVFSLKCHEPLFNVVTPLVSQDFSVQPFRNPLTLRRVPFIEGSVLIFSFFIGPQPSLLSRKVYIPSLCRERFKVSPVSRPLRLTPILKLSRLPSSVFTTVR